MSDNNFKNKNEINEKDFKILKIILNTLFFGNLLVFIYALIVISFLCYQSSY